MKFQISGPRGGVTTLKVMLDPANSAKNLYLSYLNHVQIDIRMLKLMRCFFASCAVKFISTASSPSACLYTDDSCKIKLSYTNCSFDGSTPSPPTSCGKLV